MIKSLPNDKILLIISISSFFHNIFKNILLQGF